MTNPLFDDEDKISVESLKLPDEIVITPLDLPNTPEPIFVGDDIRFKTPVNPSPLILPDDTLTYGRASIPEVKPSAITLPEDKSVLAPTNIEVFALDENPIVAQAMKRGEQLHPDKMALLGHSVRSHLSRVLPYSFATLSTYGSDVMSESGMLVSEMVHINESIHEINAQASIDRIIHEAKPENRQSGLLGKLGLKQFDLPAANAQLQAIGTALQARLSDVVLKERLFKEVQERLTTHVVVMSILSDMTDHNVDGNLVARKTNLFDTALQEIQIALGQIKALQKQAQEWIMRCEEIRTVVLPSYGLR